jgi:hypothetical protein
MPPGTPPPPPPLVEGGTEALKKKSRLGFIVGLHLGLELPTGQIPPPNNGSPVDVGNASAGGFAYALDGGIRFARQWYVGLTLEHAGLGAGRDAGALYTNATSPSSNTTAAGVVLGLIVNPDRPSFYGEIGVQGRWFNVSWNDATTGAQMSANYTSAELLLGAGVWVPLGSSIRLLPLGTVGIGTFNPPNAPTGGAQNNPGHAFFMLGLAGFYNLDM